MTEQPRSQEAALREALHAANVGCTWDEQIPKQRMCDPSWHDDQADRLLPEQPRSQEAAPLAEIEATVRYHRADTDKPKVCICCPGEPSHVFGYHLEGADGYVDGTGGGWVFRAIRRLPEGTRVRLTITEVAS